AVHRRPGDDRAEAPRGDRDRVRRLRAHPGADGVRVPARLVGMTSSQPQHMGHGINQRALIRMTPEEVEAYLAGRPVMTMCTLRGVGSIHAVGMWYGF